jgi:hypothetical protein
MHMKLRASRILTAGLLSSGILSLTTADDTTCAPSINWLGAFWKSGK